MNDFKSIFITATVILQFRAIKINGHRSYKVEKNLKNLECLSVTWHEI